MRRLLLLLLSLAFPAVAQSPVVRAASGSAYVLLGKLTSANMNSTADQSITITLPTGTTKYSVVGVDVTNCTVSLTLAAGGIYTAASKGGSAIVASTQVYTGLTGTSTNLLPLTLAITTSTFTSTTLYFSLTTAQGGAATADVYVWGRLLP
jgi:hypothetical protein